MKKPPLIDNPPALREKIRMLDVLKELDVANKYIELALNTVNSGLCYEFIVLEKF